MNSAGERGTRVLCGLALGFALPLLLGSTCVLAAKRIGAGMGWDQLANAVGGFAFGGVGGVVLAVVLSRRMSARRLKLVTALTLACAALLAAWILWRMSLQRP